MVCPPKIMADDDQIFFNDNFFKRIVEEVDVVEERLPDVFFFLFSSD